MIQVKVTEALIKVLSNLPSIQKGDKLVIDTGLEKCYIDQTPRVVRTVRHTLYNGFSRYDTTRYLTRLVNQVQAHTSYYLLDFHKTYVHKNFVCFQILPTRLQEVHQLLQDLERSCVPLLSLLMTLQHTYLDDADTLSRLVSCTHTVRRCVQKLQATILRFQV